MSTLYTAYLQEKEGKETLELPDQGFVTYRILGDICHVCILYVAPKSRGGEVARILMNSLLKKMNGNCKAFTAVVDTRQLDTSKTLQVILRYGFEVVGTNATDILLYKEIR